MNSYFHFKQFTVHQEKCAMKVTEIACIQGAWSKLPAGARHVLDIGCGTGLLTLMTAQKNPEVKIDAVEIDEMCFTQAMQNIEKSAFKNQIKCIHADIKTFAPAYQYDFIITNPPFFEHHLKSPDKKKNTAWHSDKLTLKALITCIDKLLKFEGCFSILLPAQREEEIIKICSEFCFFTVHTLQVRHSEKHPLTHMVFIFSKTEKECKEEIFTIKEEGEYTESFVGLLGEFYLKL